ncbi:hypothetical protein UAW_00447 [Enterococcus haemoperoxidus ATCC BAA-382]|uniref:Uncharacterized protein n=1 Tax=Enterococcus haemoperoxidus ATCC BAA-382 TaxID=1158608 RepID=R2QRY1_9ENTE|nr:hypothetical protein [Enterococcus haemoperoxidus]EOH99297.1 hypothetical protein UAW_00447 [Enterococcus haemoperoxidus ATCC BAA-382]EOT62962.1 hypothetical protein I583_01965 [Enterococcus haemoperoxidus ATCC BAA-382]
MRKNVSIGYKKAYINRLFRTEAIYIMLLSNTFAHLIQFLADPVIELCIGFDQIIQLALLNTPAALGIAGILGVIFALYPAVKLDPITALRYE